MEDGRWRMAGNLRNRRNLRKKGVFDEKPGFFEGNAPPQTVWGAPKMKRGAAHLPWDVPQTARGAPLAARFAPRTERGAAYLKWGVAQMVWGAPQRIDGAPHGIWGAPKKRLEKGKFFRRAPRR